VQRTNKSKQEGKKHEEIRGKGTKKKNKGKTEQKKKRRKEGMIPELP
jgi:hypothetical protein